MSEENLEGIEPIQGQKMNVAPIVQEIDDDFFNGGTPPAEEEPTNPENPENPDNGTPPGEEGNPATFEVSRDTFDRLKEIFNHGIGEEDMVFDYDKETFERFDELSIEDKRDLINNAVLSQVQLGGDANTDAFVRKIIEVSKTPGFDINNFINGNVRSEEEVDHDFKNSTLDENIKFAYTKTYGKGTTADLTEEEIEEKIENMRDSDKKLFVADFQKGYAESVKQQKEAAKQAYEKQIEDQLNSFNSKVEKDIERLVEDSKNKDVFGGFKLGQSDKEEFIKMLPEFTKRKATTLADGQVYLVSEAEMVLQELISKGQSIDLVPYLWMHSTGRLDAYNTQLKNGILSEVMDKLDASPSGVHGGSSTSGPKKEGWAALDDED